MTAPKVVAVAGRERQAPAPKSWKIDPPGRQWKRTATAVTTTAIIVRATTPTIRGADRYDSRVPISMASTTLTPAANCIRIRGAGATSRP